MSDFHLTADPDLDDEKYQVDFSGVDFEEDNVTIIYSPALDLSGYGYNHSEAKQSFKEALHEFFTIPVAKELCRRSSKSWDGGLQGLKRS